MATEGNRPLQAVRDLLTWVGQDPEREGLADTPRRVTDALAELTAGYDVDVAQVLACTFSEPCDQLVVVTGITFTSLCEHHLLPFTGTATVGYLPAGGRVVGLSKLARVVDAYAQRLQVQERLTRQVAQAIERHLTPAGVGVIMTAHHTCMGIRGARKPDATMTTSALTGVLMDEPAARAEFLALHER